MDKASEGGGGEVVVPPITPDQINQTVLNVRRHIRMASCVSLVGLPSHCQAIVPEVVRDLFEETISGGGRSIFCVEFVPDQATGTITEASILAQLIQHRQMLFSRIGVTAFYPDDIEHRPEPETAEDLLRSIASTSDASRALTVFVLGLDGLPSELREKYNSLARRISDEKGQKYAMRAGMKSIGFLLYGSEGSVAQLDHHVPTIPPPQSATVPTFKPSSST